MIISRIDADKNVNKDCDIVFIWIGGTKYTITEYFGELKISVNESALVITPKCNNEITLIGE